MKRLFLMLGAAACVALPLGDLALAQGRGHGRGGEQAQGRGDPRAERAYRGPARGAEGGPRRGRDGDRYEDAPRGYGGGYGRGRDGARYEDAPRGYGRGGPRRYEDGPPVRGPGRAYEDAPRGYGRGFEDLAPRAFAPQATPRRGGYLPDRFRGGVVEDYRRYRLRPPPHGYAWVRIGAGFALVSEDTGRVFDVIPD